MLTQKIELFGIASIWISTFCAKRHYLKRNAVGFKRDTAIGIVTCGIIIATLPI